MLVPDSATPLYLQLEEILRQEILSGSRREGDKLSTENELVEQYKVSRITVRRAVEELCKEGMVVRHPGKGTFVTGVVMRNDLNEPRGWTENAVANGYRPSTVCTELGMVPGAAVCRLFELKQGEEAYCCARRVRALNEKPAVYELDYFPPQDAEFLTKELLSGSVFRLLRQWKKLRVIREKETIIRVRYADAETADALGLVKGQPVVYTRTCYLNGRDQVVLLNEQYIDSERYVIRTGGHELRLDEAETGKRRVVNRNGGRKGCKAAL